MLIKLSEVQSHFPSISPSNVHVITNSLRRRGKPPQWLVPPSRGKKGYKIDIDKFEYWLKTNDRIKTYGMDKLYWLFVALGFSDRDMANFFSAQSRYFKISNSWYGFFATNLFIVGEEQNYRMMLKPTMLTEFVRIGTRYIYDLHKNGKFVIKNEEIFG